jgi:predicted MFS family arabinose efflux permease
VVTGAAGILYGAAALALALIRGSYGAIPAPVKDQEPISWRVTEGFRFLWRHPLLRKLTVFTAAMNIWWAAWAALFVVYAVAPGPMGLSAMSFGLILTVMAAGGIAGSMIADRLRRSIGARNALALDMVGTICLVGVPAVTADPALVGLAAVAGGFGGAVWVVIVSSIRQRLTPNALLGRAYSASRMISWGILPFGAAVGGLGAELLGVQAVFGLGAVASVGVLLAFLSTTATSELASAASR